MAEIQELLQQYLNLSPETQSKLFQTLLLLLLLWGARLVALRFLHRQFKQKPRAFYTWRKVIQYTIAGLGVILIGRIWIAGFQSLATYLGLLSAGLAIALQDLIVNLAGWGYILWQRPFSVGDRVQIEDVMGDVVDVGLLEFTLLEIGGRIDADQSTGRLIHFPNGVVFKESIANAHQGFPFIWNEIPVLITFESDWRKARRLLEEIIRKYTPDVRRQVNYYAQQPDRRFVITYNNLAPTIYTEVAASGVRHTLRYLVDPRKRRRSEEVIWEAILTAFGDHWDIDFAYETTREYVHWREKKRAAAAPPQPAKGDSNTGSGATSA